MSIYTRNPRLFKRRANSNTPYRSSSNNQQRQNYGQTFVVRLRHRKGNREEFLASSDFSVAELSINQQHAWRFRTVAAALASARLALGMHLHDFEIDVLPIREEGR
jgi:hypothetical protein